ncbi:MAG: UvrD-helicase domain-containing protein, partial [Candidatus Krumholzibacteria bacterium]|nr:UvrD-helicase domain-containing protein [Candidatus Krumholzibacteria bacterium]
MTVPAASMPPGPRAPLNLSDLNAEQRAAVEHMHGPLLVFAGAGSGKTRVITYRIAHLIAQGVAPWNILAVTFTNKAANEMRERVVELVGEASGGINIGTFHGQALRILRRDIAQLGWEESFSIYDANDQLRAVKQAMADLDIPINTVSPVALRNEISRAKDELTTPFEYAERAEGLFQDMTAKIYHRYQRLLRDAQAVDFGDMIAMAVRIFREIPEARAFYQDSLRYVLVDEYQDTNRAQYYFIRELAADHRNVCVVGDDDQSIYSWRGADIRNILDFESQFPDATVVRLERNYRSTKRILAASNAVVSKLPMRAPKTLWTEREEGD